MPYIPGLRLRVYWPANGCEVCAGILRGLFSSNINLLLTKIRDTCRKLRRHREAWLCKNISKKIFRPADDKTLAPGLYYPTQTEPIPLPSTLLLMNATDVASVRPDSGKHQEDTMLYTSHLRKIVFATTKCLNNIPKNRIPL